MPKGPGIFSFAFGPTYPIVEAVFAVVDLETTGGQPHRDRITEVAIFVHDGTRVVEEFQSLVNPGVPIPPFITRLTGISNEMVREAPPFHQVARRIVEITEGHVLVAHNARFDYAFLKKEFLDLGYPFARRTLCTVRAARKWIPGLPSYSLGKLCGELSLPIEDRHRAFGDARATTLLLDRLIDAAGSAQTLIDTHGQQGVPPRNLKPGVLDNLPDATGVYHLHDEKGDIVYIGKSRNIRSRVQSHLRQDVRSPKPLAFRDEVHDVSFELTGNDLVALLLEQAEVKRHRPKYNRQLKRRYYGYGLFVDTDAQGYVNFRVKVASEISSPLVRVSNREAGEGLIYKLVETYGLCLSKCFERKFTGECPPYLNGACRGACQGGEAAASYNDRANKVVERYQLPHANFFILGKGRQANERAFVCVEDGQLQGFGYLSEEESWDVQSAKGVMTPLEDNKDARGLLLNKVREVAPHHIVPFEQD